MSLAFSTLVLFCLTTLGIMDEEIILRVRSSVTGTLDTEAVVLFSIWALSLLCFFLSVLLAAREQKNPDTKPAGTGKDSPNAQLEAAQQELRRLKSQQAAPDVNSQTKVSLVTFLQTLQEKGRVVDFAMEDVSRYSDEQIGAVARIVHQGLKEVLEKHFQIHRIHQGQEGDSISLAANYDAAKYSLANAGEKTPPCEGRLLHPGWITSNVELPRVRSKGQAESADFVIQPAQVELS